jgi:diguanylate cyclase (GGDEF)-like protein
MHSCANEPITPASNVSSSLDFETVLSTGLETVVRILGADGGWIILGGERPLGVVCRCGIFRDLPDAVAAGDEAVIARVLSEGEPVLVEGVAAGPWVPGTVPSESASTLAVLPLQTRSTVLGVVVVASRRLLAQKPNEIEAACAAGSELASAIERALLFRGQLDRIERQRLLLEAAETINRSLDSFSLESTILAEAARLVRAPKAALLAVRGDVLVAQEVYGFGGRFKQLFVVPLEGSPFASAVTSGETVAAEDVDRDEVGQLGMAGKDGYRAFLAAPLRSYKGTSGVLVLFYDTPRSFVDDEKLVLRTFAVQAAIALDNRRLMREKDQMAVRDGLTGVYNRSYLELTLERTAKELRRNGGVVSILFVDLDGLKKTNDSHGHRVGDGLLRDLAALLVESCRATDIVARYGGDEFVVLMPSTNATGAGRVVVKVHEAIQRHNAVAPGPVPLSASIGVHTTGAAGVADLLHEADRRMYAMKRRRPRG